jgi:predicted metal-dependent hydrolase
MQLGLPFGATDAAVSPQSSPEYYFVRHRRARRYLLRVDPDGRVRVTIPRGGSRREADAFARRNRAWIDAQLSRVRPPAVSAEAQRRWRAQAKAVLPERLYELAVRHQCVVKAVSIRSQRTRWGSCGRNGHISLNWRLMLMPHWVRDYVLIHELMHLKRLDHSPKFWRLVEAACPDYRAARQWLRANGPALRW